MDFVLDEKSLVTVKVIILQLLISSLSLSLTVLSQNGCKLAGTKFSAVLFLVDLTIASKLFGFQWDI